MYNRLSKILGIGSERPFLLLGAENRHWRLDSQLLNILGVIIIIIIIFFFNNLWKDDVFFLVILFLPW